MSIRSYQSSALELLLIAILFFVFVFSSGCSRTPTNTDNRTTTKVVDSQPKFSEVTSEPSDTGQILALAEAAYAAKDWEAAEKHYVSTTRAIPKEATPWFRLGNIYARTDRPDFAVRAYKEALLRDPEMGKAWYNMGLVQLRQSANSFLQMRTYTQENSEAQIRADTMYEATIALIKEGPNRAKSFPYASGGAADIPSVKVLPAIKPPQEVDDLDQPVETETVKEPEQLQDLSRPESPAVEVPMTNDDRVSSETIGASDMATQSEPAADVTEGSSESQDDALDTTE